MKTTPFFVSLFILMLLFFTSEQQSVAQQLQPTLTAETGLLGASSETPFWHYANTRGRIFPGSQFNQYTLLTAESALTATDGSFDFGYGASALSRVSDTQNAFRFEQLYAGVRFGGFQLKVGRFHDEIGEGMIRTDLSFGSMIQSQNAVPIPKIQFRTVDYIDVPLTNGVLSFKGMYSDGILESDREIISPYVHQKSLHAKISIENGELMFGVIHNVVWAGEDRTRGQLPNSFGDYIRIVTSQSAQEGSGATGGEINNRLGNTVAAYDFAGTYTFHNTKLLLYRQIFLEGTGGARSWRSYWDGTYGIGLQRVEGSGLVNSFMYELIHTIEQESESRFYPQGRANYYGHNPYRTGWTYKGSVIGNPLLTFDPESQRMINNVVVGHHIGVSGDINPALDYKFYVTYTRNHGVCEDQVITGRCNISDGSNSYAGPPDDLELRELRDIREHQFSFLVDTSYLVNSDLGLRFHSSIALDVGQFHGNRIGFMAGVSISDW